MTSRTVLLILAAALMIFGAAGYSFVIVPDVHGDLIEIGVRPSVLGVTVLHLYFAAVAMFAFALMVSAAAIQSARGIAPARLPLAIIALLYIAFGTLEFSRSHNPHHLGPVAMGILIVAALVIPGAGSRRP